MLLDNLSPKFSRKIILVAMAMAHGQTSSTTGLFLRHHWPLFDKYGRCPFEADAPLSVLSHSFIFAPGRNPFTSCCPVNVWAKKELLFY